MKNNRTELTPTIINLQIGLNRKMYESGKISHDMYSKTNEILLSRLTNAEDCDIITLNDVKFEKSRIVS